MRSDVAAEARADFERVVFVTGAGVGVGVGIGIGIDAARARARRSRPCMSATRRLCGKI